MLEIVFENSIEPDDLNIDWINKTRRKVANEPTKTSLYVGNTMNKWNFWNPSLNSSHGFTWKWVSHGFVFHQHLEILFLIQYEHTDHTDGSTTSEFDTSSDDASSDDEDLSNVQASHNNFNVEQLKRPITNSISTQIASTSAHSLIEDIACKWHLM